MPLFDVGQEILELRGRVATLEVALKQLAANQAEILLILSPKGTA